jgi:hypothetical protein
LQWSGLAAPATAGQGPECIICVLSFQVMVQTVAVWWAMA